MRTPLTRLYRRRVPFRARRTLESDEFQMWAVLLTLIVFLSLLSLFAVACFFL